MLMIKKNAFRLSVVVLVIFVDQLAKFIIRSMGGFYICNLGIAFGIEISMIVLALLWILFLIFAACYFLGKCNSFFEGYGKSNDLGFCLILGGGISNLIDRFFLGCVVDFIDLGFFPIFNTADAFITLGAIMMIWKIVMTKKEKKY